MLHRHAYARFLDWKATKRRRALLVTGARQVGKTFLIERFLEENYEHHVTIDLIDQPRTLASFTKAVDSKDLMLRISAAADKPLLPHKTAIFIDEIQEFPDIVTHIKYLAQRTEFDFVFSGSLLGTQLEGIRSLPIGYASEVEMFPLDFDEFCLAAGLPPEIAEAQQSAFDTLTPVPDFIHDKLTQLYHHYLLVGGMPDAVAAFADTGLLGPARSVQQDITRFYLHDISKYAPASERLTIQNIYRLIPSELSGHNRRFMLKNIPGVQRYSRIEGEFKWLVRAGVALQVPNASEPVSPLLLTRTSSRFKLYYSDVGLLTSTLAKEATLDLLDGKSATNLGGVYENAIAQELHAHGHEIFYHSSRKIGELDFAFEQAGGALTLLEVKSGRAYRTHAALDHALATYGSRIDRTYVLAETNIEAAGQIVYLPLYMAHLL